MTPSKSDRQLIYPQKRQPQHKTSRSRFWIFGLLGLCGVLVTHAIEIFDLPNPISIGFESGIELFQALVAPEVHAWMPIAILFVILGITVRVTSPENRIARGFIVASFLALILRYLLWRVLYTLDLSTSINRFFSLGFLLMEVFLIATQSIRLFLTIGEKNRHREADRMSQGILDGSFGPSVDILIPTYDEPPVVLRRTIIGCQAIDYSRKKIYVLDDTRRSEIADLARELGCEYITRPDNRHAKAGNLNHAIDRTQGDLIVVLDADFIPTQNFIERTAGFFQRPSVGLVQTHQCFYNSDIVARNLGLEDVLPHEFEMFFRQYQLMRDGAGSVVCSGSAFVVRRSALEEAGGFVTESLCEDYYTSIRLSARGYEVLYLDENLSAGLIAESMPAYLSQRQRWARGTLQGLFLNVNPLTIQGLKLRQRICHIEGIVQWFANLTRIAFLLVPIAYYFFGILPLRASVDEWFYFFLPCYLINFVIFSWLNRRSLSIFVADIYAIVQAFPVSATVVHTLIRPFAQKFKVTPKGIFKQGYLFHYRLAAPLVFIAIATILGFTLNWLQIDIVPSFISTQLGLADRAIVNSLGNFWAIYNLVLILLSILCFIDVPQSSPYLDFQLEYPVCLQANGQAWLGTTQTISEVSATVILDRQLQPMDALDLTPVQLEILEEGLEIPAQVCDRQIVGNQLVLTVLFDSLSLDRERHLIELLFCRPGRWDRQASPGELKSAGLLIKALFRPKFARST
ncbi:MAG: glycosyltransferase [Cyanobacteriota bacterium]|nr:glycosyltransferase [Cyanobacteriota bacterium]